MQRRDFIKGIAGSAALWPLPGRAQQQPKLPLIGYLSTGSPDSDSGRLAALRVGLEELGYIDGQNFTLENRWAHQYDELPLLAIDLVHRNVAAIVTVGTPPTLAAKAATSAIPIIFSLGIDPIAAGLVTSLSRPSGNLTGVAILSVELLAKRFELMHQLVPTAIAYGLLVNPANAVTDPEVRGAKNAASSLGLHLSIVDATSISEIDAAFAKLVEIQAGALVVSVDPFFISQRSKIIELAARHRVPTIYGLREFPVSGGLISYGTSLADSYRIVGNYVGKILKGTSVGELPVQQTVKIEFVINLKSADTLGLTIPMIMQMTASEVIN